MVGAGFLLTETGSTRNISPSAEAIKLCEVGSDQVQSFKFAEGAQNLEMALELDPSLAEAAISLANVYWRLGRNDDYKVTVAMADSLTSQIANDDRRMLAQMRLGVRHKSRFNGMLDSLMIQLEKSQPDDIHFMITTAQRLGEAGLYEEQFETWHHILEKNPNYAEAYNRLGYFELNRGHYQESIEHMKKYAFLAPDLANPHDSLGDVLMVIGQYEEAASEFRAAVALQPDFHFSYINLGKSYLYRGMLKSGTDIMNQVQDMVAGSELGLSIDHTLMFTYLEMNMISEIEQTTLNYIVNYPDHELSPYFRSIRLAHMDKMTESQALMDSTLTAWRSHEMYHASKNSRNNVDMAAKRYEGYMADLADQPSTRVRKWGSLVAYMQDKIPAHDQWNARLKLARAYMDNAEPLQAQEQIRPILEANNRLIPALILAVRTDLALENIPQARQALEQLKWSIQQSDDAFYARQTAAMLEERVVDLEGNS